MTQAEILADMERDIEAAIVKARIRLRELDSERAEKAADNVIDILEGAARISVA